MLALRSARAPLRRALTRNMCAPAVPLVDTVRDDLAMMKEKIAAKAAVGYTPEAFSAAVSSGTVDPSLLSTTMDFSDDARKMAAKLTTQASLWSKEMEKGQVADFSAYEGKVDDAILAEVKGIFESELAKAQSDPSGSAAIAAVQAEWTSAVEGSDGLLELAAKEEKAAEAGLLQCITDMEKLEVDVQGVAEVTIGEILDREPELRAEIEEEIKNNVWAP